VTFIKVGGFVLNLDLVISADLDMGVAVDTEKWVRVVFAAQGDDGEPYYEDFVGEEAEALRRFFREHAQAIG
jgi:hypothetical protein